MVKISESAAETMEIAKSIAASCKAGQLNPVICLTGDLGAGKTVFAKGFAEGLGITSDVTSPTFAILNEYNGAVPLYHFDVYRIKDISEMYYTGYEDYFYSTEGVCLIEWADMIKPLIPDGAVWITITAKGENIREINIETK